MGPSMIYPSRAPCHNKDWGGPIDVGLPGLSLPMTLTSLTFKSAPINIYSPLSVNYLDLRGVMINYNPV